MYKFIIGLLPCFILSIGIVKAQDNRSLLNEGIQLHAQGNYEKAVEKYRIALQAEPENQAINYQMAFSLNAWDKKEEALPYLQTAVSKSTSVTLSLAAYNLMGSIFDHLKQPQKAIESYKKGIQADSLDLSLHYNLGLAYSRNKQHAEAEQSAVAALELNPKHLGSIRLFGLASFHQDKRAGALLAFSRILELDTLNKISPEAYSNIQNIFKGGVLKTADKSSSQNAELNQLIYNNIAEVNKKKPVIKADLLAAQLQSIYSSIAPKIKANSKSSKILKQWADYYEKLAESKHMAAFARVISRAADPDAAAWLKVHTHELEALQNWSLSR